MQSAMKNEKGLKKIGILGLLVFFISLVGGCIGNDRASSSTLTPTPALTFTPVKDNKTTVERVSDEMDMLRSKGWSNLASQFGRPKAAALLWYHLRASFGVDPKLVFGNPNKLDAAIAIQVKNESDALPKMKIKGVEYYVINPMVPEFIGEFKYGDMFDDPGGGNNFLASNFRLRQEDVDRVEKWMAETGARIEYSDFAGK